jgi:hypothetical protein
MSSEDLSREALTSIGWMQHASGLVDDALFTSFELQRLYPDLHSSGQNLFENAFKDRIRPWRDFLRLPIPDDDPINFPACRMEIYQALLDFLSETILPPLNALLNSHPTISDDAYLFYVRIRGDAMRFRAEYLDPVEDRDEFEAVRSFYEEGHVFAREKGLFCNLNYLRLMANYTNFIFYQLGDEQTALEFEGHVTDEYDKAQSERGEVPEKLAQEEFAILQVFPRASLNREAAA